MILRLLLKLVKKCNAKDSFDWLSMQMWSTAYEIRWASEKSTHTGHVLPVSEMNG